MKVEQHILDEIRDIAPTLIKVGRENPFRVPPQYWSTFRISTSMDWQIRYWRKLINLKRPR